MGTIVFFGFLVVGSASAGDDRIDLEAIKKETLQALSEKERMKIDLSYITEEFVRNALKAATPSKPGSRSREGEEIAGATRYDDYGNHYFVLRGTVYFQQGDPGTATSFTCGTKYWRSRRYASITVFTPCIGGFCGFHFEHTRAEDKKAE